MYHYQKTNIIVKAAKLANINPVKFERVCKDVFKIDRHYTYQDVAKMVTEFYSDLELGNPNDDTSEEISSLIIDILEN